MAPNERGWFCSHCAKTVVDLTQKSQRQIQALYKASGGQLCGRMSLRQMLPQPKPTLTAQLRKFVLILLAAMGYLTLTPELLRAQERPLHSPANSIVAMERDSVGLDSASSSGMRGKEALLASHMDGFGDGKMTQAQSAEHEDAERQLSMSQSCLPKDNQTWSLVLHRHMVMGDIGPLPDPRPFSFEREQIPTLQEIAIYQPMSFSSGPSHGLEFSIALDLPSQPPPKLPNSPNPDPIALPPSPHWKEDENEESEA
jgi:hypothetical protein